MAFEVARKVALITGAASGLGYHIARKFLKQGLKGVAVLDVNEAQGYAVQEEFTKEFGQNSCIYVKTDVSKESQMEDAFKQTVQKFKQLDIVVNNAAVISELDWKKCVDINLGGCLTGTRLAIDTYLPQYKNGPEALIINISSILGLEPMGVTPVYTATKQGIVALSRCYGIKPHYDKTKVRVLTICPGHMTTPMILAPKPENFNSEYQERCKVDVNSYPIQPPEFLADCLPDIIKNGENGSVWVVEGSKPAYEVEFKDRFNMRKK